MKHYKIIGGKPLKGTVNISGAKNAALPILAATVLTEQVCYLENIPDIADVETSFEILRALGVRVERLKDGRVKIDPSDIRTHVVPKELSKKMRASYYYLGSLLGRFGRAFTWMPGGCNFCARPIDLHLKGFRALGADVNEQIIYKMNGNEVALDEQGGKIIEDVTIDLQGDRLCGNSVYFDQVSVGATINIMMAAVKAHGLTVIENPAKEPHVVDLANFLNHMGADVRGAGTDTIKIYGVDRLFDHEITYSIIPDQIEAGTYMAAAVATKGEVRVCGVIPKHLESISTKLEEMGVTVTELEDEDTVVVSCDKPLRHCRVKTMPHPGFPTDMQPQMGVLLSMAEGESRLTENVWEQRFQYLEQLKKMGANVEINGDTAVFEGVKELHGASVKADDLRAGAAMVIAALAANGESTVGNIRYIERGYEKIIEKLTSLGANIVRISDED